ncbi:histidine--tRNA ligase [Gemella sp. GL1.1]|nr:MULTISPECIES: histidine--tRNA ligase [unclassified Gemella]MBF0710798.1 histidine--tRNA ligase [Gemella sp. GL1.1]MBF0746632.1 histidine--tRNA ligase [Gemella sp. 19428wG2_WT2a]NYS28142.1 histidine--tRNA ligase [Gemella sp. GL1]TFU59984.1 histidine--tRNA ligase [Gemella sp. WT2a]
MNNIISVPRGTQDILPVESRKWQYIENKLRELSNNFCYEEIRTPMFESTELFARGVGETTDIVSKEMYTFLDKSDRSLTLRPEGTAGTVRSYIENKLFAETIKPQKLFYIGPMFRYERKQKGRYRQFVQYGVEVVGEESPMIDAEVISLAYNIYRSFGIENIKVAINSLGNPSERQAYNDAMVKHFETNIEEFCSDCKIRIQKNPMRILDCKIDAGREEITTAPKLLDYLGEKSRAYFDEVTKYLDSLEVKYEVDPNLVRGLDYYTHTAFEIMIDNPEVELKTLCGGGRYNGLVEMLGGPEGEKGIGFALSIERLLLALESENITLPLDDGIDLFIVFMGKATDYAVKLTNDLRLAGFKVQSDYFDKKMKSQMKLADRYKARYTIIIGDKEIEEDKLLVKDMANFSQEEVSLADLELYLEKQLRGE